MVVSLSIMADCYETPYLLKEKQYMHVLVWLYGLLVHGSLVPSMVAIIGGSANVMCFSPLCDHGRCGAL